MNTHKEPRRTTRRARQTDSICIQITTSKPLVAVLDRIVKTGFFGGSRAAAAERLLSESLREVLREGVIQKRNKVFEGEKV